MGEQTVRHDRGTMLWPLILIGAGVVWLLREAGILTSANLSVLFRLWPILLIAIGLELLIGRSSRALSALIAVATVVVLIALMIVGPSIGLAQNAQSEQITEPLREASRARVVLEVGVGELNVTPLSPDSPNLLEADIRYVGDLSQTTGEIDGVREVRIQNQTEGFNPFQFLSLLGNEDIRWDLQVNSGVPLELAVSTGTGGSNLDLSAFDLTSLTVNAGTGGLNINLPSVEGETYEATIGTGTGGIDITIAEDAALTLRVSTGTGGARIDVPDDAAVRLEGNVGTGGIDVPDSWQRIDEREDSFVGEGGVWETAGFADASRQIVIHFSGGTGGLDVE